MFVFQLQGWVPTDDDLSQMINNFSSLASFGDSAGKLKMFIIDHNMQLFQFDQYWLAQHDLQHRQCCQKTQNGGYEE